ncbi:carbohydrate ABC transporter permease [Cetobacterium sp. SF1]|uniref:carbohydrate ABC transporter permease n=1 Tax=unclassified Cetobacterium TaxID=2630983 RepID=UPI003CF285CD
MKKNNFLYYISVIFFLTFTLGPIFWCFIVSITPEQDLFSSSHYFFPRNFYWNNYISLLNPSYNESLNFYRAISNSLYTSVVTIFLGLPISIISAYSFSNLNFHGKNILKFIILSTLIIPVFTTIIPLYIIFSSLGILDNLFWLSVIYISSFLPINTWICFNYFKTIPKEIEEMALIDGCNNFQAFMKIILPNSYPIIFTSILILFLMSWSQYQIPLILAASRDTKPLSILIAEFSSKDMILYGKIAAAGIIAIIPPAIFAIIFRKYLVSGLTKGSITG